MPHRQLQVVPQVVPLDASVAAPSLPAARPTPSPPAGLRGLSFARGLWRIAQANVTSGNVVRLLVDGPQTFGAMLEAVDAAEHEVALESYIFDADVTGERFAAALLGAAKRGVRVRVLVDWIGSRDAPRAFWARLRAGGVDVRVFSPPGLRGWLGLLPRDHRKLLVVDGAVGFTGGFGLSDWWSGHRHRRRVVLGRQAWRDTAVRIEGPGAVEMQRAFESMWDRVAGRERRRVRRAGRVRQADPAPGAWGALVGIVEGEPWRFRAERALHLQTVLAERQIWIATAYFIPSISEIEALGLAARDGVDVRILVPGTYDHPWVATFTRGVYRRLLASGVRIWEWRGAMMHAKTTLVDGRWVRVGSTDFNPLGVAINHELDAVIEDAALGAAAEAQFLADLEQSAEVPR